MQAVGPRPGEGALSATDVAWLSIVITVLVRCGQASLILKKFDKDKDGELGLEDMKALMKKINKK